ncbi:hypothetical protein [Metabacillus halosaccharovorans]|uniref:Uncharacterized protein n=1 Tax=Metabacillus halosaccharovorans TaxID=930124 RepID=A0ABT3DHA9_9BACI|nr:hypothetical protein [Metabacillus halosaccharovorans]MCV9886261.1 hypothetical protein [Metabacillus halosaccharovorans]
MQQLSIFDVIENIPQAGDRIDTKRGMIRIIGTRKAWNSNSELILFSDSKKTLMGMTISQLQRYIEGEEICS